MGPVWQGGSRGEAELLAACYRASLALARTHGVKTIAFPAISCGVYRYPVEQAVAIAVHETAALADGTPAFEKIIFACFDRAMREAYVKQLERL